MTGSRTNAPQERINIVYTTETGGARREKELPLKLLVIGDFTQAPDGRAIEDRAPVEVHSGNVDEVLAGMSPSLDLEVPDTLGGEGGMAVQLRFARMRDFAPEAVARQVPQLARMLELRAALHALRGPLGNIPAFRKRIQAVVGDGPARARIGAEIAHAPH